MEIQETRQDYVKSGCLLRPMVWVSVCGALGNLRFALVSKESCQTDNFWESPEFQTLRENGRFAAVLVGDKSDFDLRFTCWDDEKNGYNTDYPFGGIGHIASLDDWDMNADWDRFANQEYNLDTWMNLLDGTLYWKEDVFLCFEDWQKLPEHPDVEIGLLKDINGDVLEIVSSLKTKQSEDTALLKKWMDYCVKLKQTMAYPPENTNFQVSGSNTRFHCAGK